MKLTAVATLFILATTVAAFPQPVNDKLHPNALHRKKPDPLYYPIGHFRLKIVAPHDMERPLPMAGTYINYFKPEVISERLGSSIDMDTREMSFLALHDPKWDGNKISTFTIAGASQLVHRVKVKGFTREKEEITFGLEDKFLKLPGLETARDGKTVVPIIDQDRDSIRANHIQRGYIWPRFAAQRLDDRLTIRDLPSFKGFWVCKSAYIPDTNFEIARPVIKIGLSGDDRPFKEPRGCEKVDLEVEVAAPSLTDEFIRPL